MILQTKVDIGVAEPLINPGSRMLFTGSCFADNIGRRFIDDGFRAIVNPYGVMYNPASVMHTIEKATEDGVIGKEGVDVAVFTLGTNHVYILNETGEIVDNCQKRPQRLFTERELTIEECTEYLKAAVERLATINPKVKVIFTVSPIRYAKYGYHESQLSKATLLLAVERLTKSSGFTEHRYFPSYEIMNDELRDYRFYQPDMLHPTEQAVDYIYKRFTERFFTDEARQFVGEWQPIRRALNHRPFNAESEEYKAFLAKAKEDEKDFRRRWKLDD